MKFLRSLLPLSIGLFLCLPSLLMGQGKTRDDLFQWNQEHSGEGSQQIIESLPEVSQSNTGSNKVNACATSFVMNTPYNTNNGQRGCMFDVLATNTVTVRCFDVNLYSGTTADYEIYYRAGTHVGNENNSAAWTFLGGATGITSAGNNVPTALPISISVTIPAGQTYAFYITNTFGGGTSYTDGAAVGNFLAGDANISVFEGVGKSYPFGLTFTVRNFNGHIFYDLGSVLDARNLVLDAQNTTEGIGLAWNQPAGISPRSIQVFRSTDGTSFDLLHEMAGSSPTYDFTDGSAQPGIPYLYKVVLEDEEGQQLTSNLVHFTRQWSSASALAQVYPNPFSSAPKIKVTVSSADISEKSLPVEWVVRDLFGKKIYAQSQDFSAGVTYLTPPLEQEGPGIYFLELKSRLGREVHKLIKQ